MFCGFDSNKVTAVDCAAEYFTALACINRKAFACESRCVESRFTLNNNAVKRNSFVWLDFNDTSDFYAFGGNNLFRTVNNNCCCIGTNVCKLFNVTAGCVNCSILKISPMEKRIVTIAASTKSPRQNAAITATDISVVSSILSFRMFLHP